MTRYLTVAQLVEINAEHGGSQNDWDGLAACAHRPQSGAFGQEAFPDLWSKAAAYVHGIASTQYFSDANKRTAWYAAVTFLRLNGYPLPDVETIDAETFVQAVAQNVFNTSEDPDLTIKRAAEWFRVKYDTQRVGPCRDRRLEFAFLSPHVVHTPIGPNVTAATIDGFSPTEFPTTVSLYVVGRIHWDEADMYRENVITGFVVDKSTDDSVGTAISEARLGPFEALRADHPKLKTCGVVPAVLELPVPMRVTHPGKYEIVLDIDGQTAATLPMTIHDVNEFVATEEVLSKLTDNPED